MPYSAKGNLRGPTGPTGPPGPDRFTSGNSFPVNPVADDYHFRFGFLYRYNGTTWDQITESYGGSSDGWDATNPATGPSYLTLGARTVSEVPLVAKGSGSTAAGNQIADLAQFGLAGDSRPLAGVTKDGTVYGTNLPKGVWTAFTITAGGGSGVTFGNGVQDCAWKRIGDKTVAFRIYFKLGTTSHVTAKIAFGPLPFAVPAQQVVSAFFWHTSTTSYTGTAVVSGATTGQISSIYTHTGWADNNSPFSTWEVDDYIRLGGVVEIN